MAITIHEVKNQYQFDIFLHMPQTIYDNDPFWTSSPVNHIANQLIKISPKNIQLFVAVENNAVIGRVAAMINNQLLEKDTALFGYFECINNSLAASALMTAVETWAKNKGYRYLTGPVSCNPNDSIGMLVEGFNLPTFGMPYNHYYYPALFDNCNFNKYLDLLAYRWTANHPIPNKLERVAKRALQSKGLILRPFNLNYPEQEAVVLAEVHNSTMEGNWGAETLSVADATQYLYNYRAFADPDLLLTASINGEPAGVCLTIPDSQSSLRCRVAVMGVVPKFRTKGIAALLIYETVNRLIRKGYLEAELSLIMENNTMMNRILKDTLKFDVIKRFRVYRKTL